MVSRLWPIAEPQIQERILSCPSNSWPILYPCRVVDGVMGGCVLCTWRRLKTISHGESCGAAAGVRGTNAPKWKLCPFSHTFSVGVELHKGCPLYPTLFVILMDRISSRSLKIASLFSLDDMVLLASSDSDLQHALGQFAAGMRVGTLKSEAIVLC